MIHRVLMALYPPSFRRQWQPELDRVHESLLATAREKGAAALLRTHLWLALDALRSLPGSWRDALLYAPASMEGAPPTSRLAVLRDMLIMDGLHSVRLWVRTPGFALPALATLSLGMGAAVAIFSVVYAVLLRPLEYRAPDRVAIAASFMIQDVERFPQTSAVAEAAPWRSWRAGLRENDGSVGVRLSAAVGAEYFKLLGVTTTTGRLVASSDSAAGEWNVVAMSWDTWQKDFAGRPDIVGTKLSIDSTTYTVVGVTPRYFTDPLGFFVNGIETAFFRLLRPDERRGFGQGVLRLEQGATPEAAHAQLEPLLTIPQLPPGAPALSAQALRPQLRVLDALAARTEAVKPTLYLLSGAVALLLLIGCANTANLLLTRSSARSGELTVRAALGASRSRLAAQLLTESMVLAFTAAVIGTWIGYLGAKALVAFAGSAIPRSAEVGLHPAVLAFAVLIATITAVASGLFPIIRDSAAALATREIGRGIVSGRSGKRIRNALVVSEVALAVLVASVAGLLLRSLWHLEHVDTGFDAEPVLTVRVTFPPNRVAPAERLQRHRDVVEAIRRQPSVRGAAAVNFHALAGGGSSVPVTLPGETPTTDGRNSRVLIRPVMGDYFGVMGIAIAAGQALPDVSSPGAEPIAVINRALARRLYGTEREALDRPIIFATQTFRVVGIAEDTKEFALDGGSPATVYVAYEQAPQGFINTTSTFLVRADANGHDLTPAVRGAIRSVDPNLPVAFWRTMRDMMNEHLLAPRLRTILLGSFGGLAALLAIVGLAATLAYTVSQTIPEIGVRLALGATTGDVSRHVLVEALVLTATGLALGIGGALAAGRLLQSMVFEIAPNDPLVLTLVSAATVAVALLASWLPASRAASVDPATVLRSQ